MVREKNADQFFRNFVRAYVDVSKARKEPDEVLPIWKSKTREDNQIWAGFFDTFCLLSVFGCLYSEYLQTPLGKSKKNLQKLTGLSRLISWISTPS